MWAPVFPFLTKYPCLTVGEGLAPPDNNGDAFCLQRERSHFEGTNTPSKGFLLTFCPRRQKVTKNAFGVRVIAEIATLCVACSIACQRYHTPDCPHLRPNKDGLDARGRLKPPKLVKPTVKRGSRGVFVLFGSAVGRGPHMGGR